MFRLTLFALLLTFVALSYANPSGDPFELEEDYDDYEQGIFDNLVATRPCEGRIELVSNSGATKRYKLHCSLFLLICSFVFLTKVPARASHSEPIYVVIVSTSGPSESMEIVAGDFRKGGTGPTCSALKETASIGTFLEEFHRTRAKGYICYQPNCTAFNFWKIKYLVKCFYIFDCDWQRRGGPSNALLGFFRL